MLVFDELAYRLLLALIRDRYEGSPLDRLRDDEETLLAELAPQVTAQLDRLFELPHLEVVDVLGSDVAAMNDAMTPYRLRPRDALHLAVMQRLGCRNFASTDHHFDRAPHIVRYAV